MQQQKNAQSSRLPGTGGRAYRKAALLRKGGIVAGKTGAHKVLIMRSETPVYGALLAGFDLFSALILARITVLAMAAMGQLRLGWPSGGGDVVCHCAGKFISNSRKAFLMVTYG